MKEFESVRIIDLTPVAVAKNIADAIFNLFKSVLLRRFAPDRNLSAYKKTAIID